MSFHPSEPVELSIGSLSAATGVPVDTLRTWERRYGFPAPIARTEGSHRRYAADTIPTLQLIVRALELGHRPSAVIGRDPGELARLLGAPSPAAGAEIQLVEPDRIVARWLGLCRDLDGAGLSREFHLRSSERPALDFLERLMGPFLVEIGARWADGELRVSHEHHASEHAREFLSTEWRRLAQRPRPLGAAKVVLATPPGEQHVLGLHMAAWALSLAGSEVVFLGADVPIGEIVHAADQHACGGIALSIAAGYSGPLEQHLRRLTRSLPRRTRVCVGGAGAPIRSGVATLKRFEDLQEWANQLNTR